VNINDAFPSHYLKASDLGDAQPVVSIDRVEIEAVGRDKEMKPVVYFVGKEKGIVLNKTNSKKIAQIASSPDTDDWRGVKVTLYATETEFGGETVECIRIKQPKGGEFKSRPVRPEPEPEYVAPMENSDIPFAWLMPLVLPALAACSLLA